MKCDKRTSLAQAHCSAKVGIFCCKRVGLVGRVIGAIDRGATTYALDLVLTEIRDLVHQDKRKGAAEVNDFVEDEGHDAGGEDIVLHIGVPCGPCLFKDVEVDIILRDIVKEVGVGHRSGYR